MSEPEVMLWSRLRGRGVDRPTFRRQHPIGPFILDFYCPSVRLAVEVDGSTHWEDEARRRDEARDRWLEHRGVTVMRIAADEVYSDVDAVADRILLRVAELRAADRMCTLPAPSTARSSAGGPPPAASRGR
jgi:very-short-patch-repair endonuclease